jgi:hypothetical protein
MLTIAMTEEDVEALSFLIQHTSSDGSEAATTRMTLLTPIKRKLEMLRRLWRPGGLFLRLSNQEGVELYCYLLRLSEHPIIRYNRVWNGLTIDFLNRITQHFLQMTPQLPETDYEVSIGLTSLELDLISACIGDWQDNPPQEISDDLASMAMTVDTMRDVYVYGSALDWRTQGTTKATYTEEACTIALPTNQWKIAILILYAFRENVAPQDEDAEFFEFMATHLMNTINIALTRSHPLLQDEEGAAA